jgi:hypothetical protein
MMDRVVIQFSSSTAWQSWVIRKLCHSDFSHVDLVLPDGNLLGASDMGPLSPCLAGSSQGVAIRPPNYQEFYIRRNAVIATPLADRIYELARSQLGKPFDSGAMKSFFGEEDRNWEETECWFCSELVAWCFMKAPYWSIPIMWAKNRVTPGDFIGWFTFDPNFRNREQFLSQIPGLMLGKKEK